MNILKKLKLYGEYRKCIKINKKNLEIDFGIRVDMANRMYTVLNVPDFLGEPYNLRSSDIDKSSEKYITSYVVKLNNYLNSIGMSELYTFYQIPKKVDRFSYLIVIGFKYLNSAKVNNVFYYIIIPLLSILILVSILNIF